MRRAPRGSARSRARRRTCTSVRPAIFATAISHSAPTDAKTRTSPRRDVPTRASLSERTSTDQPASVFGNCLARLSCTIARSRAACSIVTPGFSRPTPLRKRASALPEQPRVRLPRHPHVGVAAVNDAGITPTIGYPLPPMVSARPIAEGSRLKRLVQKRSLITTAFGPVSRS